MANDPFFRFPIDVLTVLGAYVDPITGNPSEPDQDELQSWMALRERALEDFISQRASVPSGAGLPFFGTVLVTDPPNGYYLMFGADLARVAYPYLFAALNTTYGLGDGLTTFGTPDMRGRIPVGLDDMGGADAGILDVANTLGATGGEQYHTLTLAESPIHAHGPLSAGGTYFLVDGAGNVAADLTLGGGSYAGSVSTTFAGSGTAHNNMQPFRLSNWILKT